MWSAFTKSRSHQLRQQPLSSVSVIAVHEKASALHFALWSGEIYQHDFRVFLHSFEDNFAAI